MNRSRTQIAIQWLNLAPENLPEAYTGELGREHKKILDSHVRYEPLDDAEKAFVNSLLQRAPLNPGDSSGLKLLLALMLYVRADQVPIIYDLPAVPGWFINDFLNYMFDSPSLFQEAGEADRYYLFMYKWINYLYDNIFANQDSKFWQDIAWFFTHRANFIPLYFNTSNLKDICSKRSDIIEFSLKIKGYQIDHTFQKRPDDRQKIRLGILTKHFGPMTETFSTLPFFEHLDRNCFEIFLYAMNLNGNPLEQHCHSRADKISHLSGSLSEQIQIIRADDLDIILISTNIAAVTHPITMMAIHRLARIQIATFNSPITTGVRHIDYYMTGKLMEPKPNSSEHYREKLALVEGSGVCFSYTLEPYIPAVRISRKELGIPEEAIVFISSANLFKLTPELRETWAKILSETSDTFLVLMPFGPSWTNSYPEKAFMAGMCSIFAKYGVGEQRLRILKAFPNRADVKEALKIGNIYLDSYPYSGSTSLVDPLEVGLVPIVREGETLRSRMGAVLLREISVSDLITDSEHEYVKSAVKLASDRYLRNDYRNRIAQKMKDNPPFLDSKTFSSKIGDLLKKLVIPIIPEKEVLSSEFVNRVLGTAFLHGIDPTDSSITLQLRDIRKQLADFWLKVPSSQLESMYSGQGGIAERTILDSGFRNQPLLKEEGTFLQSLISELTAKTASDPPAAINYLLAAMLYMPKGRLNVQDARRGLPGWLIGDYEKFF